MMRAVHLLNKLPSLHSACLQYQTFKTFAPSTSSTIHAGRNTATEQKNPSKSRHHAPSRRSQQQNGKGSFSPKGFDPIRPVSDKLLRSLMERHSHEFSVPACDAQQAPTDVSSLSTPDLIQVIHSPHTDTASKAALIKDMEVLLIKRLYTMSLETALQACHAFYQQKYNFHPFLSHMLSVVDEVLDNLSPSPSEITRLMLYVFIHGNAPSMLLHRVEEYLMNNLHDFHINDLGVICLGFFKSNSRITSQDLLDAMADRLLKGLNFLEPFLLLDFLKMFRHASYIKVSFYQQLADDLARRDWVLRYNTINPIMHVAFTFASLPVHHAALFESLFSRMEQLLLQQRRVRTKDVSKFVWACGTLQFRPENYEARYSNLVRHFEASNGDSQEFPESLAEMLMGLVYLDIFPEQLLHKCLSRDVAMRLTESGADKEKSIQLLLLNESLKIERPHYTGNLLSETQLTRLLRHPSVSRDLEAELQRRVGLLAVTTCLQRSLGHHKVHCHHPFLHFKTAVVELQYNEEQGFLSITPSPSRQHTSSESSRISATQRSISDDLYTALTDGVKRLTEVPAVMPSKRVALVVSSSSQYTLNNNHQPLGHLCTMKRQLAQAGYLVVEIPPERALRLEVSSHEERCRHLSAVLSSALETHITLS